jgi:hypothetical protein
MEIPIHMSFSRNLVARAFRKVARIIDQEKPIQYLNDEYVTQLCFINAGIIEKGNIHSFEYAISHLPSASPILEIGSFCGLSANILAYFKKMHRVASPLITCDKWEFQKSSNCSSVYVGESIFFSEDGDETEVGI